MRIQRCPYCEEKVKIKKVECCKCGIGFEGDLVSSPLMSLSEEQQMFIELFVLSSGSLKEMAEIMGITYPTVRVRLNEVILELKNEMRGREEYKSEILKKVDQGKMTAEKAAEIIKNL